MNPKAFGLANAAVYGLFMALLAWFAMYVPGARRAVDLTAGYYPGYQATPRGGMIGALYGLSTGFAMGWVTAWLYNRFRAAAFLTESRMRPALEESVQELGAGI